MPAAPTFVHLRVHTEYSVVDGTLRIDDAAQAARADGQGACAITDLNNVFGAIKFYKACRGKGVKPLIGADLWMEPEAGEKQATRLLLLVMNNRGYLNLCQLLAWTWTRNAQRSSAWVKWSWLEELGDGLIALSGADAGVLGQALLAGDDKRAEGLAQRLQATFPGRFYVEVQRAGLPTNDAHVAAAVRLASRLGLPVVATHPVQFLAEDDFDAHEARVCVAEGELLSNPRRVRRFSREQHFTTQAQMAERFADLPVALAQSVQIARRCNLTLVLGKPRLPDFPTPGGIPLETYFRQEARAGLERRLLALYPDADERERQRPTYAQRLDFELDTIVKMGFPGYFMIVSDFIVWAKNNGCPVGPGRGSGAGSLVAYSLFITDLDPLRYQLLFERFLNPERVSMPDFDIDFCQGNRDRVIEYVKDKYGREAVSQIATFGTMAAKAALRDIGRVLGMGYGHVDSIAKLIPAPPGKTVTLAPVPEQPDDSVIYARKEAPELNERERADEEVASLLALATRVEGMVRNVGMHAGGVLIAPGKITDFCPLYQQPGSDSAVSMYDKDDVEASGLVKFDFLGLATLTILELAKEMLRARRPDQADFTWEAVPFDDRRVYKLFTDGLTEAVFQFESRGMQNTLREGKPTRLEDLIALNAMFRPGPMENIPSFCRRKNGQEPVSYPHPSLEPILSETYGIFVYQEQVMQAAQVLGGYSLGAADLLRRAMGKKKPEEMAQQRNIFRSGAAAKHGITEAEADEVFDLMEKFAGYGFNKSHAAAYSVLAYHTAWLKVHGTAEFYAANMTIEMDNTDKLKVLLADAGLFGVAFEPPDINRGHYRFEPISDKAVRYGLGAVKGTGQGAIAAIVAARDGQDGQGGGRFNSLFDFCARVDRKAVNKRAVEALVKAGAFDSIHADRAALVASIGLAFDWADTQEANAVQVGLFDFGDGDAHGSSTQEPPLTHVEPWTLREKLMNEKQAIGFYLTGHLFDVHADEVRRFARTRIADVVDSREAQTLAGIVSELRVVNGQRGRVVIFQLDDGSERIECVANEELYEANRTLFAEDELMVASGRVQLDRFAGGLRMQVNSAWSLTAARARFGRWLHVEIGPTVPPVADVLRLWPAQREDTEHGELVRGLPIRLKLRRQGAGGGGAEAELELGEDARFWPCDEALARWRGIAQRGQAVVVYE